MSKSSTHCGLNWATLSAAATEPSTRQCYDPTGVAITLKANDEKASGGEGIVYTVPGKPGILVKVYKRETLENPVKAQTLRRRIEAMCANGSCKGMHGLAWPLMPVYGDAARGKLIGFAMRACKGVPFSSIFAGPASVKAKFPSWNRCQLAKTAVNFVRRVRELSEVGVFVNDFNPANFWVDEHCNVSFIDADSFQLTDRSGRAMITHTFFASHAAPELLANPSALNRPRTIEQVAFSTALVVFQLLMCGYHPYSYQGVQGGCGCGSPDENLRVGRCPLGIGADCRLVQALELSLRQGQEQPHNDVPRWAFQPSGPHEPQRLGIRPQRTADHHGQGSRSRPRLAQPHEGEVAPMDTDASPCIPVPRIPAPSELPARSLQKTWWRL